MFTIRLFLFFAFISILSACASSPKSHYYHLQARSALEKTFSMETVIVLEPIKIPEVLQRDQVVSYRKHASEIILSDFHLWASDLQDMVTETTLGLLQNKLVNAQVIAIDQTHQYKPNYYLTIRIEELAGPMAGPVTLRARWQISDDAREVLHQESSAISETVEKKSYAAYVLAINRLLDRLSLQTADRTSQLVRARRSENHQDL